MDNDGEWFTVERPTRQERFFARYMDYVAGVTFNVRRTPLRCRSRLVKSAQHKVARYKRQAEEAAGRA